MSSPAANALDQYATTAGNLTARMAIHAYGTHEQDWFPWLRDRLPLAGRVLEVGAGTGELWTHVDHRGVPLTLTDFSPVMCARLRAVPGAAVVRADATALPFPAARFDTVIANHMLYHLDDPADGLREFARVLRPGGRLSLAVNGREHMRDLYRLGGPSLADRRTHNGFSTETAHEHVSRFFADVVVEPYRCDLEVPAVEPVLAYLASMVRLSPAREAAVRAEVAAAIAARGSLRIRKDTALVTATRRAS